MNAIKADINALEDWVKQLVANSTPEDAINLIVMTDRHHEKVVATKRGHVAHIAVIAEKKRRLRAQMSTSLWNVAKM
eukprot:473638-Ditylum_brightwellii.AAC.1